MHFIYICIKYPDEKFIFPDNTNSRRRVEGEGMGINGAQMFSHPADVSVESRQQADLRCPAVFPRFLLAGEGAGGEGKSGCECEQSITAPGFASELPGTHALIAYTRAGIRYRPLQRGEEGMGGGNKEPPGLTESIDLSRSVFGERNAASILPRVLLQGRVREGGRAPK